MSEILNIIAFVLSVCSLGAAFAVLVKTVVCAIHDIRRLERQTRELQDAVILLQVRNLKNVEPTVKSLIENFKPKDELVIGNLLDYPKYDEVTTSDKATTTK